MKRFAVCVVMLVISIGFAVSKPYNSIYEISAAYGNYSISDTNSTYEQSYGISFKGYSQIDSNSTFGFVGGGYFQFPFKISTNNISSTPSFKFSIDPILNIGMWKAFDVLGVGDFLLSAGFSLKGTARESSAYTTIGFKMGVFTDVAFRYWFLENLGVSVGVNASVYFSELAYYEIGSFRTEGFTENFFAYELIPYISGTIYIPMK